MFVGTSHQSGLFDPIPESFGTILHIPPKVEDSCRVCDIQQEIMPLGGPVPKSLNLKYCSGGQPLQQLAADSEVVHNRGVNPHFLNRPGGSRSRPGIRAGPSRRR